MTYSEREFGASQSDYPKEQQMSDIVERLRLQGHAGLCPVCLEAADFIDRLRAGRAAVVEACGKRLDEEAETEDSMVKVMANNRMYGVAANHQTAASFFRHAAELVRALKGGAA
jgi:hypothetical protein